MNPLQLIQQVLFRVAWYRWNFRLSDGFGAPSLGAGLIRKRNRNLLQQRKFDEEPKIQDFGLPVPADLSLEKLPTIFERTIEGVGVDQFPDPFLPGEVVVVCRLFGRDFRIVHKEEGGDREGQVEEVVIISCRGYRDIFLTLIDNRLVGLRRKYGGTTRDPVLSAQEGCGVARFMLSLRTILGYE